jgi:hypothetical protein
MINIPIAENNWFISNLVILFSIENRFKNNSPKRRNVRDEKIKRNKNRTN